MELDPPPDSPPPPPLPTSPPPALDEPEGGTGGDWAHVLEVSEAPGLPPGPTSDVSDTDSDSSEYVSAASSAEPVSHVQPQDWEKGNDRDPFVEGGSDDRRRAQCSADPVPCEEPNVPETSAILAADADSETVPGVDSGTAAVQLSADSQLELVPNSDDGDDAGPEGSGIISRLLRASMRKMWHFRLSSRGLRRRSSASQQSASSIESSPVPSRTAQEVRASRSGTISSDEPAASPSGGADSQQQRDQEAAAEALGLPSISSPQTQAVYMSALLDRLNTSSGSSVTTSPGSELILVSTREPHLHDAPLPALDETSVTFDTPPPPLPAPDDSGASGGGTSSGAGGGRRRSSRLLSRGSSFLGVYQTVPELGQEEETRRSERGYWQHNYSSALACFTCTVGVNAICRFALFGGTYGVAFIIQFFVLTLLLGLPLMTLHMTLGQYMGAGLVDMWRVSPVFKGIGLAVLFAEFMLGVYTIVPTAWMFVYLRDSFVSSYDRYKWADCPSNCTVPYTELVTYAVPEYFNTRVLQRDMSSTDLPEVGYLGFEISFNLAVTWILVYLSLGRGLRSYGKVVYLFVLLAVIAFITVCIHLLSWSEGLNEFFTDKVLFDNVFWRAVPWVVAARETFMIWGLHGAALMAAASHNRFNHCLRRDTTLVALVTSIILFLSALFGYSCLHSLKVGDAGYIIGSSSFETEHRSRFLIAPGIGSSHSGGTPPEVKHYTNLVSGVIISLSGGVSDDIQWDSGYQVERLATELFPSLLAAVGGAGISSFWALVFYLALILFGIGQQLAVWRAVVEAVISLFPRRFRVWELTITFLVCLLGFMCSLPLMTQIGIHLLFFLDYCIGCLWWLVVLFVLELFALFYIRGSPFSSTQVVTILISGSNCMTNWAGPFLSFIWHVILPMALLVLSVVSFRTGGFDAIFTWDAESGYGFWGLWVRQLGSMLMLFPILVVPVAGLVQAIRFVKNGQGDLYDRIQSLYRPAYNETQLGRLVQEDSDEEEQRETPTRLRTRYTDPPPKYTPPPSYSTATGARFAKMFRQSMRRSIRRMRQLTSPEPAAACGSGSVTSVSSTVPITPEEPVPSDPPPSYASVIMETLPAALRRSLRRVSNSLRSSPPLPPPPPPPPLDTSSVTLQTVLGDSPPVSADPEPVVYDTVTHPPAGHKRSYSLGLSRPLVPETTNSRSLPRALSPEEVRQILRTGRLSQPETSLCPSGLDISPSSPASLGSSPPGPASLGSSPPGPASLTGLPSVACTVPQQSHSLPRDLTPEQVRQLLRSGRLPPSGQLSRANSFNLPRRPPLIESPEDEVTHEPSGPAEPV